MSYDDVLPLTGGFNRHQWKLYFLSSLPIFLCVTLKIGNVLLVSVPKYRCRLPFEQENASFSLNETVLSAWYPYDYATQSYSSCHYYLNSSTLSCSDYVFADNLGNTIATEFKLTCGQDYLIATSNSLTMLGFTIGGIIFGSASDRWGRKKMFMISDILYLLLGFLTILSPNIWVFLTFKVLLGIVVSGAFYTLYVLLIESTEPAKRVLAGSSLIIFFPMGMILISLFGYLTTTWRHLQIIYTIFGLPCLLNFWILPESSRWLVSKKRHTEAKKIIQKIAKENKVVLLEENIDMLLSEACTNEKPQEQSIMRAMRFPRLRIRILILFILCLTCFMSYYGVTWNVPNLNGNLYLNMILMGLTELPGYFLTAYPPQKFGRRPVLSIYCLLSGLSVIILSLNLTGTVWPMLWTIITKFFLGSVITLIYMYSSEIYPTVLRNSGLGFNGIAAGVGAMIAPYVFYLNYFWTPSSYVIFAGLLIITGCLVLTLPETLSKKLPDTLEEGEAFGWKKVEKNDTTES